MHSRLHVQFRELHVDISDGLEIDQFADSCGVPCPGPSVQIVLWVRPKWRFPSPAGLKQCNSVFLSDAGCDGVCS